MEAPIKMDDLGVYTIYPYFWKHYTRNDQVLNWNGILRLWGAAHNPSGLRIRKNSSNKNAVSTGPQQAWLSGKQLKSLQCCLSTIFCGNFYHCKTNFPSQLLPGINFPFTVLLLASG